MFGFQRVADLIWNAADCKTKGFLLGGTAGRTTLSGEGLQHEDGQSHLYAASVPSCHAYDPAFGYEVAVIIKEGLKKMVSEDETGFYYLTLYNENYPHPAMPDGVEESIIRGMYCLKKDSVKKGCPRVQLLGSGSILLQVVAASRLLSEEFGVAADIWSITSFTELQKDGVRCDRRNLLHPESEQRMPFVTRQLQNSEGPIIAATDYMRAYPDLIRGWIPRNRRYKVLGTDGFGCSDSRQALRDFFEIDARYIALAALTSLVDDGLVDRGELIKAVRKMEIDPAKPSPLGY